MEYDKYGDLSISGSGKTGGGVFNRVHISGSAQITGDIECADFHADGSCHVSGSMKARTGRISGSAHVVGSAEFADGLSVSGTGHMDGCVGGGRLSVSGSLHIGGDIQVNEAAVSGSMHVGGSLAAKTARISGELTVGGDCGADTFRAEGGLRIDGLLNADTVELRLHPFHNRIREIGGGSIRVEQGHRALGVLLHAFVGSDFILTADTIEGDEVWLEHTKAAVVRGKRVTIGPGCEIGRVEYDENLQTDGDAKVGESHKR